MSMAPDLEEENTALRECHREVSEERDRYKAGLQIILASGAVYGGGWCVAQARGYLENLDFDAHPETGKE